MKQADQYFDDNLAIIHLSDFEGTLGDVGSQQPFPSSPPPNIPTMDPAQETDKGRRRVYLACHQCRSRKIKCDGAHPVCSTCIRRRSPKCDYDDEPRRRGPDRHPRVRTHQDSGPFPSSIRPRRSQKRSWNDVVASPINLSSSQSPPSTTPDASANIPHIGLSKRSPTPPKGSFDSTRHYPSPSTSSAFRQGSMNVTPTYDFVGGSPSMRPSHNYLPHSGTRPPTSNDPQLLPRVSRPSRSTLNSFPALHPEPSSSTTGIRDQSGNPSLLLNPSAERPYANFIRRSIVDTQPLNPYLRYSDPRSSNEPSYAFPMQVATQTYEDKPQIVRSPYIFAPPSFPVSMGTSVVHSALSVEATNHEPPFAYNMNFLPMASSRMHLFYNPLEDFRDDPQSHEDPDETRLGGQWVPTPHAVVAPPYEMLNQPSVEFPRQMWWESLVRYYGGARALAPRRIVEDLTHLFRVSNSMISFINVPLFFSTFHHSSQREHVQPSLVLAMLALSILLQSSDIGLGQRGRLKALELRDLAQCHFDLSLNSGWITPDLAQAALLLVYFEACCHPAHSESRARSALFLLDSLILGLGLLDLDQEYNVTIFRPNSVPSLAAPFSNHIGQGAIAQGTTKRGCSCSSFQLSATSPSSRRITPLWAACPGWNDDWDVIETRREEQRNLVWQALYLTSGFLSHYSSIMCQNLSLAKAWNFKVFFPAEKLFGTPQMQVDLAAKRSIWALHARCHMLYTTCLSVHHDESISEYDKGQFAVQAWLESEQIKQMLDAHTCEIEKTNLYFGRQILFDTQNLVSSHYTRYVPHPSIGDPRFHRDKALLWLSHQQNVMQGFLVALSRMTGLKDNSLATRPYFTFWFHDQLARYLDIWQQDPTLNIALDLCVQLLRPAEYLMALFPSNYAREKYEVLHLRLVDACIFTGIAPPSPPSYIIL